MAQAVIAALVVAASAAYAAWVLMPGAWRRAIARRLGRTPPAAGCGGCGGCDSSAAQGAASSGAPIEVHRRGR